jgi:hypothetical protein
VEAARRRLQRIYALLRAMDALAFEELQLECSAARRGAS